MELLSCKTNRGGGSITSLTDIGLLSSWGIVNGSESVYTNRVNLEGDTVWGEAGSQIWQVWADQPHGSISPSVNENGIIVWRDTYDELGYYDARGILAQCVDTSGNVKWSEEVLICGTSGSNPKNIESADNGGIVLWEDNRNGNSDVYAAHVDSSGNVSGIQEQELIVYSPLDIQLVGPNPTINSACLRFSIGQSAFVTVNVFDAAGRRVDVLKTGYVNAGSHDLTWDGGDNRGVRCPSGVYFIRVAALGTAVTQKVVLTR